MGRKDGSVVSSIRFSADEHAFLKAMSKRFGIPRATILKTGLRMSLGVPTKEEANIRHFQSLERQFVGVARNLNQLTRSANSGRLFWGVEEQNEICNLQREVEEVRDALRDYLRAAAGRDFCGDLKAD